MKTFFRTKGFFLVETMVVIGIVGIVITFLFATFSSLYNSFNVGEYYDTIDATNAAAQIRLFLQNKEVEAEDLIDDNKYVEITNLSILNDDYFVSLKNNLNVSRIFIINLQTFYTDSSINDFSVNAKGYLNSIKDDIAQYKIFVITKNNTYGSVSILNYTLTLEGDPDNEYAAYLVKDDMYVDPGFTAIDSKGNNMEVTVTGFVDNTTPGTYYLTYNLGILSARRKVVVYENIFNYEYTGNYQIFTAPIDGNYRVQLWGASGGGGVGNGKGGYVSGEIYLFEGQTFYVYVGQNIRSANNVESFNGGISNYGGNAGGGATDIRLISGNWKDINSLKSRIIIAAGGGAGSVTGAHGGGLVGLYPGTATGGTQTTPGTSQSASFYPAAFGMGGGGCGGGGGYYGGGGAACASGGAGGSAFISGHTGCDAITQTGIHTAQPVHYSGYKFSNTVMYAGNQSFVSPTGSNETGHIGNGYARITLLEPTKTNILSNVRYIYTQVNGSTTNDYSHFVELQAYNKVGVNVAYQKIISEASYKTGIQGYWQRLTDGIVDTTLYISPSKGLHWAVVDLGQEYDLSSVRLWHYYADSRKYYDTETRVAGNDGVYRVIDNLEYMETPDGRIIRP